MDIEVTSTSPSVGSVSITNQRTTDKVTKSVTAPTGKGFTGSTVQWIVEDFQSNGANVPFANFQAVTFTDCEALAGQITVKADSASIWELAIGGKTLISSSAAGDQVVVKYL